MRRILPLLLVAVMAATAVGCGSSGSSSGGGSGSGTNSGGTPHHALAKTRFLLHAGLAFGAFHHFIYKPYREGRFRAGAPGRKATIAKAVLAAGFTYHEVKKAREFAQSSPTLQRLFSPLSTLTSSVSSLPALLRRGGGSQLDQINNQIGTVSKGSASAGSPITERVPPALTG